MVVVSAFAVVASVITVRGVVLGIIRIGGLSSERIGHTE
jgi:hypothetical protein